MDGSGERLKRANLLGDLEVNQKFNFFFNHSDHGKKSISSFAQLKAMKVQLFVPCALCNMEWIRLNCCSCVKLSLQQA